MGSVIHRLDPIRGNRPVCRTRETGPLMTDDKGIANCPACKAIMAQPKKGTVRLIGAGQARE